MFDDAELPAEVRRERGRTMPDVMAPSDCLKLYHLHRNDNANDKVYHGWWLTKDRETGEAMAPRWTVGWGKRASADRKIQEALDTSYGYRKAGNEVTVGFAAMNYDTRQTRWAAIDWDYTKDEPERAATWAKRAFHVCSSLLGMTVLLEKSGRGGWHLFLYGDRWRPVEEWTRWMEQLCLLIGVPQDRIEEDGTCELFPPKGAWRPQLKCGNAIRLPGSYNGKAGKLAEVVFESVTPMLAELATPEKPGHWRRRISDLPNNKEEKLCSGFVLKDSAGKVMPEQAEKVAQLLNIDLSKVEISNGRRRAAMKRLNGQVFPKAGKPLALALAEVYFNKAGGTANCRDWPEHLREVEETWAWMSDSIFLPSLTADERAIYDQLDTDTLRDAFRIIRNFAWADARKNGRHLRGLDQPHRRGAADDAAECQRDPAAADRAESHQTRGAAHRRPPRGALPLAAVRPRRLDGAGRHAGRGNRRGRPILTASTATNNADTSAGDSVAIRHVLEHLIRQSSVAVSR